MPVLCSRPAVQRLIGSTVCARHTPHTLHRIQLHTTPRHTQQQQHFDTHQPQSPPPPLPLPPTTTHFGNETVLTDQKHHRVAEVFTRVAGVYDTMNDVMSLGIHRLWKDIFISMLNPTHSTRLLDVGGGTGDIAFRFINAVRQNSQFTALSSDSDAVCTASVVISDINPDMLAVGQQRARELGLLNSPPQPNQPRVSFQVANAEQLPFNDNEYDAYTIAFCIRNVTNIELALADAYRVLRKGGRFMCLEFSHVTNPVFKQIYDAYSDTVIPALGHAVANDRKSYEYLVQSIRKFPNQDEFAEMIRAAGFVGVSYVNMTGGIVAVHSGYKL